MSFRTVLILLVVAAGAQVGQCQVLGFSLPPGKTRVQFPIEVYNNLVVVPMILNNQLPLKFILDTGVRTSILTEKAYSDILNLPYSRKYTIAGPGGEKLVDAYVTNNVSLDLPGVQGRGHAMLVLDQDYLELRNYLGTDVHGILGYELFSRFIIEVNYEQKMLTLMLPQRFREKKRFEWIPIQIEDTKPYLTASIEMNDTTVLSAKLLVDSGASHGLFLETTSNPKIRVPERHVTSIIGRGLGGVITGQIAKIKSIKLGKYEVTNVITNFPDPNSYMDTLKTSRLVFRNGSIGGEVLSRFTVIYNFPGEKIYLKKNSSLKKEFFFNLSGLTVRAKGARLKNFEITDVRMNSASQLSDVKSGDRILSVNGIEATDLDLNTINAFLNSKPGRRISLQIERDGVRLKKEFRLEDPL
ncbi:MAG: aspartyl protease family protein [Cyclobacteriaceae bacterium]|nr:aspartyl protease family protein [Cyclobacteriaceae bacterium]